MRKLHSIESLLFQNGVIDNNFNKINKIYFDCFAGNTEIKIGTGGALNNGYIFVDVVTESLVELYYKDILIFSTLTSKEKMIPCLFEDDSKVRISGECEKLSILVYGANILSSNNDYHLPLMNKLVRFVGDSHSVYSYTDCENVKNNQMLFVGNDENLIDMQVFAINSENYIAKLTRSTNGLNLQTSMDNYAGEHIIIDNFDDAVIVPDYVNNRIFVCYIRQNGLYYKIVLSDMSILEENEILNIFDDKVKSFSKLVITEFSLPMFALNLNNNKTLIMILKGGEFVCRLVKKAQKLELFCNNDILEVCAYESNMAILSRYNIVSSIQETTILSSGNPKQIFNVDKVLKIGSKLLLFNGENCTEVDYENIFGN